jgi:hypothetical protein
MRIVPIPTRGHTLWYSLYINHVQDVVELTCRARMVLSPLGRWVSMDMTTQFAMIVRMIRYSNGGQLTNQTNIRLEIWTKNYIKN